MSSMSNDLFSYLKLLWKRSLAFRQGIYSLDSELKVYYMTLIFKAKFSINTVYPKLSKRSEPFLPTNLPTNLPKNTNFCPNFCQDNIISHISQKYYWAISA
jgi:hypothetical protein